jgi:hypothetical protein
MIVYVYDHADYSADQQTSEYDAWLDSLPTYHPEHPDDIEADRQAEEAAADEAYHSRFDTHCPHCGW